MRVLSHLLRVASPGGQWAGALASGDLYPGAGTLITQLTSLRALQWLPAAGFSSQRPPRLQEDGDGAEMAEQGRKGHLPRVSGAALRKQVPAEAALDGAITAERQGKIRELLGADDGPLGAANFVAEFFAPPPASGGYGSDSSDSESGGSSGSDSEEDDVDRGSRAFDIATPDALEEEEEEELLEELRGLRKSSQRAVLQKLLQGGMLRADPTAMAEWQHIQKAFQPPQGFRMKVVDVNRTCKGSRSGGLYRFSTMVVVGNGEGVLGWGQGKAAEVNAAVKKAYTRACRNLYPVPRYNQHTIPLRTEAKFGKVKVVMYPKSSGRGVVASPLVAEICKMAGIHDIGVKVHGSRNPRNTVKCLFVAFDGMKTHDDIVASQAGTGRMVAAVPPGRFGRRLAV